MICIATSRTSHEHAIVVEDERGQHDCWNSGSQERPHYPSPLSLHVRVELVVRVRERARRAPPALPQEEVQAKAPRPEMALVSQGLLLLRLLLLLILFLIRGNKHSRRVYSKSSLERRISSSSTSAPPSRTSTSEDCLGTPS